MRRIVLTGWFLALVALLLALWSRRFELVEGPPVWRLADLRAVAAQVPGMEWRGTKERPVLRVSVGAEHPQVAIRLALPGAAAVEGLHFRYRMRAEALVPGAQDWEDGRFLLEWHDADGGGLLETEPVASIRDDVEEAPREFVLLSRRGRAVPALRLEHLGRSGAFELDDLEITVVRERALWKAGKWLLAAGWLAWVVFFLRSWPEVRRWRAALGAALMILVATQFVIPGPWKAQRALYPVFHLGESTSAVPAQMGSPETKTAPRIESGALPSLGKIPDHGSLILQIKVRIAQARPLLHMLLLAGPALLLAWLVGWRPALPLLAGLACAIELAQFAFGYGFDWQDVGDLATDAAGIALGLWLGTRMKIGRDRSSGRSA